MTHRRRGLSAAAIVEVIVATAVMLPPAPAAAGQDGAPAGGVRQATPRTPWGDPDLQGIWTTDWERSVPFRRPARFGERTELSAEELAGRAAHEAAYLADDKADFDRGRPGSPMHWYEFGDRTSPRTSLIVDPPTGRIPPLTLGARARHVDPSARTVFVGMGDGPFNGPEDLTLDGRCITRGLPQTWYPKAYNNGFQIVQSPGYVAVLYERLHEHRIIPLDGRAPLTPDIRLWFGDSRGRWEGETLVVEVTNFSDRTNFRGAGATRRLIEYYTRVDAETVRVEVTIDDPATWTRPWSTVVNGIHDPDYWQVFEYACHEGNYGLRNVLSAARNLERAAAEKGR